jgi:hypothetical protein
MASQSRGGAARRQLGRQLMGIAKYEIFGKDGVWRLRHDGKAENEYATKEAAFEAAIAITTDA